MAFRTMMVVCALFFASPALAADKPMGKLKTMFYNLPPVKAAFGMAIKPHCREFATPVAQGSNAHSTYGIGNVKINKMAVSPLLGTYQGSASVVIGVGTSIRGTGPITSDVIFTGPKPTLRNLVQSVRVGLGRLPHSALPVKVEADQPISTMPVANNL